jgi:hypothetical protein
MKQKELTNIIYFANRGNPKSGMSKEETASAPKKDPNRSSP